MAGFVHWLTVNYILMWMFAQLLFDVVAVAVVMTTTKILKLHQEQMVALARAMGLTKDERGYL